LQTQPTPRRPQHPAYCEEGWYVNLFQYYHPDSLPQLLETTVWEYLREQVFTHFCFGLDNASDTRMQEWKFKEGDKRQLILELLASEVFQRHMQMELIYRVLELEAKLERILLGDVIRKERKALVKIAHEAVMLHLRLQTDDAEEGWELYFLGQEVGAGSDTFVGELMEEVSSVERVKMEEPWDSLFEKSGQERRRVELFLSPVLARRGKGAVRKARVVVEDEGA